MCDELHHAMFKADEAYMDALNQGCAGSHDSFVDMPTTGQTYDII